MKLKNILPKSLYEMLFRLYSENSIKSTVKEIQTKTGKFNAEEAVQFLFSDKAKHIVPMQYQSEIIQLAKVIEKKKPQVMLEIGTARGGTLFLASQLSADNALVISIDLPDGMYGGGYPVWRIPYYKKFAKPNQRIELIQGDSHSQEILSRLKAVLGDRKIDYLFIDGDHTYEGVKHDFETYSKFLNSNAIVAFHDIVQDRSEVPNHFVSRYWNEVKMGKNYKEFIQDPMQSKLGLGVLEM